MVAIAACICMDSELTSMAVSPLMIPEAELTTDCPTSKTAIVIVNVLLTR